MTTATKREITQVESEQLAALLQQHDIEALIARYKPKGLEVAFNADWLPNALAASYQRTNTAGPYFITLSALLLESGLTDRTAFSSIILHELAHVIDRKLNWSRYFSSGPMDDEAREYEADDFVIACGWKDGLIETLQRWIALGPEDGALEGMANRRLHRLVGA
jgi:hypothetical protein